MTIDVTQEDIRNGTRNNCVLCPVARAVRRAVPWKLNVQAGQSTIRMGDIYHDTPPLVSLWISAFDAAIEVTPFSFELPV